MARTLKQDVAELLAAVDADNAHGQTTYTPDAACTSPVCQALARLEHRVDPERAAARAAAQAEARDRLPVAAPNGTG